MVTEKSGLLLTKFVGKDTTRRTTPGPITHLHGYATMVKAFKESHVKDLEKLVADRPCEDENNAKDDVVSTSTVLSMVGRTSPVWTLVMFQMVAWES